MISLGRLFAVMVLTAAAGCAATEEVVSGGQARPPSSFPNLAELEMGRPQGLMSARQREQELARLEALRASHEAAAQREIERRD